MNFKPSLLLLIPPVLMSWDFLPEWFIYTTTLQFVVLSLFHIHKLFSYIQIASIYFIIKESGANIIPETTIPVLAIILMTQFIQDRYDKKQSTHLFFLWFGIFSLFSTNLYYLIYSLICFLLFYLNESLNHTLKLSAVLKSLIQHKFQLFFVFTLSLALFLFFPRMPNFFPGTSGQKIGKIGYSSEINNSTIGDLQLSGTRAFFAKVSKLIPPENLYWRGRIHNFTDGYNWRRSKAPKRDDIPWPLPTQEDIRVQMKFEQDFNGDLIILDSPIGLKTSKLYIDKGTSEIKFYTRHKKFTVTTISNTDGTSRIKFELTAKEIKNYTQLPKFIPKRLQQFKSLLPQASALKVIESVQEHLINNKYIYTLKPGVLLTMNDFLSKKAGYCTHFASFLAIVLRLNGIPTRLVSGFQGGEYNEVGGYFEVSSNDAHAWVEYFENKRWNRIDPTSFISISRIQLGGNLFFENPNLQSQDIRKRRFSFFYRVKQSLDNLNYKVSLFLDDYNKEAQKNISKKINLTPMYFSIVGFLFIIAVVIIYFLHLKFKTKNKQRTELDKYLYQLERLLKNKKGTLVNLNTFKEREVLIKNNETISPDSKRKAIFILEQYKKLRYSNYHDQSVIKKSIQDFFSK